MNPQALISCRGITLTRAQRCLIENLNLDILPGQRWALIGPNGAGKSSLLLMLLGALRPHGGHLVLAGRSITDWSIAEMAAVRAWVPDRWADPFPVTVAELLQRARRLPSMQESPFEHNLIQAAHAWELDALKSRNVMTLSRGERQRVAVMAALQQRPRCLLMDEPLSNQDPRFQIRMTDGLARFADLAQMASLHDMTLARRYATHALALKGNGQWQAGPVNEILTAQGLTDIFSCPVQSYETESGPILAWGSEPV